jgi:hypothetical protein
MWQSVSLVQNISKALPSVKFDYDRAPDSNLVIECLYTFKGSMIQGLRLLTPRGQQRMSAGLREWIHKIFAALT